MNDFIVSLMLLGAVSSSDGSLPYWMTANQYGLMPERNGGLALLQAQSEFDESRTFQWKWGSSLAVNSFDNPLAPGSSPVHPMVDQLYGPLKWKVFNIDIDTMLHANVNIDHFLKATKTKHYNHIVFEKDSQELSLNLKLPSNNIKSGSL